MNVGFLGLGKMGQAMALNLARAGTALRVWNRDHAKRSELGRVGAALGDTPRATAQDCDVLITMLADDAAVEAVVHGVDGMAQGMRAGALHISMSTIATATAERLQAFHLAQGHRYISAPVLGRPEAAAAAKLFIVAAGCTEDLEQAAPLFALLGQRVFRVSSSPAAANLVKLCGNFMILSAIESMGEAMALAHKGGVDRESLLEVLTGSLFDVPLYRNYGDLLAQGRFRPAGFGAALGLKDMRLAAQSAEQLQVPMPFLSVLRDHLLQTLATEGADVDWSAIGIAIEHNAGIAGRR
jgi:3-hydroxyisobutyrate dehydrogenase-like beta-hydroxyacid dehydrogenase